MSERINFSYISIKNRNSTKGEQKDTSSSWEYHLKTNVNSTISHRTLTLQLIITTISIENNREMKFETASLQLRIGDQVHYTSPHTS